MATRSSSVSFFILSVLVIPSSAGAQTRPPVILVDGGGYNCPTAPRSSTYSFGQLEQKMASQGLTMIFFRPCDVTPAPAPLETVGQAIGKLIDSLAVPQVDVIAFGAGAEMVRAYLAGKQIEPGVFTPPLDPKVRKAVFIEAPHFGIDAARDPHTPDVQVMALWGGSRFHWDLNTWNQGTDDLREVDAIGITGNLTDIDLEGLTQTSILSFRYPDERMRVVPLCIWRPYCSQFVSYIDSDAHPSWRIINSFLGGTGEWKTVGQAPSQEPVLSKDGGLLLAVKDASDSLIPIDTVSVSGVSVTRGDVAFFRNNVGPGDYTLQADAPTPIPPLTWRPTPGGFSVATMKPGPIVARVIPSAGLVGTLSLAPGSLISIYGTRLARGVSSATGLPLPTTLGETTVTINDKPIGLHVVAESQINAVLPDDARGLVKMTVKTSEGVHSINILLEDAVPAIFTVPQTGSGPAVALHAVGGGIVDGVRPASIGEYISVYLTGLGATETSGGLQVAKNKPQATVDGVAAAVDWAGRAPGFPGLDQVNVIIPPGIHTATSVPLIIRSGKRLSNTTTLPVQ